MKKKHESDGKIHWREGSYGTFRAWKSNWGSDQFEVIEAEDWQKFKQVAESLGFQFEEHFD